MTTRRPASQEYPERYERYVALVPEYDIITALADQLRVTDAWLEHSSTVD
jgi:hypothetical protein